MMGDCMRMPKPKDRWCVRERCVQRNYATYDLLQSVLHGAAALVTAAHTRPSPPQRALPAGTPTSPPPNIPVETVSF